MGFREVARGKAGAQLLTLIRIHVYSYRLEGDGIGRKNVLECVPCSYTHLDVYKRQAHARQLIHDDKKPVAEVAQLLGVHRATIYRAIERKDVNPH